MSSSTTTPDAPPAAFVELVRDGQSALAAGELDDARRCFEEAANHFPDRAEAHNNLGAFYMGLGDAAMAEPCFERVVELCPGNPNPRFNLGVARIRQEKSEAAVADFTAVAAVTPEDPEVHNNLGVAHYLLGDREAAVKAFEQALELRPNFPNAVMNLVDLELATGDLKTAITFCQDYLQHFQDGGVLRCLLTLLDTQARKALEQAIPTAEALVQADTPDPEVRRHLGRLLEARQALQAEA